MNRVFFPGCRIKRACPESSKKLEIYMKEKYGIPAAGCCKTDFISLNEPNTTAVLICNNCIHDLSSLTENTNREYILDIIDQDPVFSFPDYHGKRFVLQDCGHGYGDLPLDKTVRSLLTKLNISYRELPKECRVPFGMPMGEQQTLVKKNADSFEETDVIVYCGSCRLWMEQKGKNVRHILDLLFV